MKIVQRIVKEPSVINRAIWGLKVVPKYPNLRNYEDRVLDGLDRRTWEDLLYKSEQDIPVTVYNSTLLPKEVGYIIQLGNEVFGVPIKCLKDFMTSNGCTKTEEDADQVWVEIVNNKFVWHNDIPTWESEAIALIYTTDESVTVGTRLPVSDAFRVYTDTGIKLVRPKGDATVYGVQLERPELLPVIKGEIVNVSGMPKYSF